MVTLKGQHPRFRAAEGRKKGDPNLLCMPTHRHEGTLDVFAPTLNSGHTFVLIKHEAWLTEAALSADGRDLGAAGLTVAIQVGARRQTGGKAVGE